MPSRPTVIPTGRQGPISGDERLASVKATTTFIAIRPAKTVCAGLAKAHQRPRQLPFFEGTESPILDE